MMNNFAFDKKNYILIAIGVLAVVLGFILMSGKGSTEDTFNPEIFNALRIKVSPVICVAGFLFIIYGILHQPKDKKEE